MIKPKRKDMLTKLKSKDCMYRKDTRKTRYTKHVLSVQMYSGHIHEKYHYNDRKAA